MLLERKEANEKGHGDLRWSYRINDDVVLLVPSAPPVDYVVLKDHPGVGGPYYFSFDRSEASRLARGMLASVYAAGLEPHLAFTALLSKPGFSLPSHQGFVVHPISGDRSVQAQNGGAQLNVMKVSEASFNPAYGPRTAELMAWTILQLLGEA